MREPKIVIWDIEIIPDLDAALENWPLLSQFPGRTLKAQVSSMCCFGYKIYGQKNVECINAWDFPGWEVDVNDDSEICMAAYDVLKDADAIVTHNGRGFDFKHLQTRLVKHGLPTLPQMFHVDTKNLCKSNLYLVNNRLGNASKWLADEEKLDHEGWPLWVKTHKRQRKSMDLMAKYCKQDVIALEKLFKVLKPFAKLPNQNLFTPPGHVDVCPNCGSSRLTRNGYRYTATNSYIRLRCTDCGASSRTDAKGRNPR